MKIDITELKDSNEFLNILLQNINSAVFIAEENLRIHQFNDSFLSLFNRSGLNLVDMTFGAASGCINTVLENKPCGETSACKKCLLKQSIAVDRTPHEKKFLERVFYIDGIPIKKYLEFTSRPIVFRDQKMILVFVYDVTQIELSKIDLEEKQKQLDIDLEKAGQIQKTLLPKNLPVISSIGIDWFFEPCLTVGGDIFHIHKENDTQISAYMLDVCGHGVSGALIAVTVKQFLDQLHAQGLAQGRPFQPEEILNALENEFPFERFDCYFTIVYILLDVEKGKLVYGCGGHVPPIIVGKSSKFNILEESGPIIGLGQDPPLTQYQLTLDPGDKIILYTDGLIDYFGKKGDCKNKENLYKTLKQVTDKSAKQIVKKVIAELRKQGGNEQTDDDISLLIIEYNGFKP